MIYPGSLIAAWGLDCWILPQPLAPLAQHKRNETVSPDPASVKKIIHYSFLISLTHFRSTVDDLTVFIL